MSTLADEIIEKLFTDWKGKPISRLIQEGTGGAGWSENAVRAIIKAAEQNVYGDSALPPGHSGSSLECMHPFCVAERESPSA